MRGDTLKVSPEVRYLYMGLILGGDEPEDPDDDEGRFFGGGLNSEQNVGRTT